MKHRGLNRSVRMENVAVTPEVRNLLDDEVRRSGLTENSVIVCCLSRFMRELSEAEQRRLYDAMDNEWPIPKEECDYEDEVSKKVTAALVYALKQKSARR